MAGFLVGFCLGKVHPDGCQAGLAGGEVLAARPGITYIPAAFGVVVQTMSEVFDPLAAKDGQCPYKAPKCGQPAVSALAVLVTVCSAQFMVPLMFTAVGVALPTVGRELGATALQLGLVEQLYLLPLAMSMLTFGRLGDILGRRKVFLAGLVVFTIMTCSLGFAQNVPELIIQRFFQGLGASMLLSGSMALVASVFPVHRRGRMIGIVSAFTYSGLTLGPILGGFMTSHLGWRYVFWMAVPLGAVASFLCLTRMRGEWRVARGETMDWWGGVVLAVGVGLVMLGAGRLGQGLEGAVMMVVGAVCLGFFLWLENRLGNPLLEVRVLLSNRYFSLSCLAAMGSYAATLGFTFFMSLYLQYVKGYSARQAGFILLLQPLMQVLMSLVSGFISDRIQPGKVANVGLVVTCSGLLLAAACTSSATAVWLNAVSLVIVGLGVGVFITPNTTAIMGSVDFKQYGVASGMIGTMRTMGMVLSMTTVTLVFSLLMSGRAVSPETLPDFLRSMRLCLLLFALFSGLGMLSSVGRGRTARRAARA